MTKIIYFQQNYFTGWEWHSGNDRGISVIILTLFIGFKNII